MIVSKFVEGIVVMFRKLKLFVFHNYN